MRRLQAVALAALAVALVALPVRPASAIAHGETVADGEFPFAVKLIDLDIPTEDGGDRDSSCSGGLISPHWILTAGHCFRDAGGTRVSRTVARKTIATIGRTNLGSDDGQQANVIAVRQSATTDVALAKLDRAVTGIAPLTLGRKKPRLGTTVRLTGYGQTSTSSTKLPQRLQTGEFRISSVALATLGMTGTSPHKDTSPCKHDSGGPYFTESSNGTATVVGVVSHGPDCPHTGPDTAGRVDPITGWIQGIIGKDVVATASPSPHPSKPAAGPSTGTSALASRRPLATATESRSPAWMVVPAAGLVAVAGLAIARTKRTRPPSRHRRRRRPRPAGR